MGCLLGMSYLMWVAKRVFPPAATRWMGDVVSTYQLARVYCTGSPLCEIDCGIMFPCGLGISSVKSLVHGCKWYGYFYSIARGMVSPIIRPNLHKV